MKKFFVSMLTILMMLAALPSAHCEDADIQTIDLSLRSSQYIQVGGNIQRVFVGSSELITIVQLPESPNEFVITALDEEGTTTLFVWTDDGVRHEYFINIEDSGLSKKIERMIDLPNVHVKKIGKRLLLTGTVENQFERNYAIQVARLYMGGSTESSLNFGSTVNMELETQGSKDSSSKNSLATDNTVEDNGDIIDLLHMLHPTKIRFEAQIIEISSDDAKDLGIQYGENGSGGIFSIGENHDRTVDTETYRYYNSENGRWESYTIETGSNVANFMKRPLRWMEHRFGPINATIQALVSKGKARVLSRPNIVVLSGEAAAIQVGGKIPYTTQTDNGPDVQLENYGIILQLKPIVDAADRISSAIHTEVSNIGGQTVNGSPIIYTRRADTVMTLESGSTIVIGGLMDSSESKNVSKIPLLGDIPILGEFFKYTSKNRDKRELIILITPYIITDDEASHVGMSDRMREWYKQGRNEQSNLHGVDLNEPAPEVFDWRRQQKN